MPPTALQLFGGVIKDSARGAVTQEHLTDPMTSSLKRKPLQIKPDEFRVHLSSPTAAGTGGAVEYPLRPMLHERSVDGLMRVHIYCGHGLKTSHTTMRDLYSVISVDSVNRARTGLRTGAINFDWDEDFEIDLYHAKRVSFSIYSWEPRVKQKLCFSCSLILSEFLEHGPQQSLALRLDPTGILYVELFYYDLAHRFRRKRNMVKGAVFGVGLGTLVRRENTGDGVPFVVWRCIEEIEMRGVNNVGLYRLCGSAKRQNQLKAQFEADINNVNLSPTNIPDVSVITGLSNNSYS